MPALRLRWPVMQRFPATALRRPAHPARRRGRRRASLALACALACLATGLVTGCGEPAPDLAVPPRAEDVEGFGADVDQLALDRAGLLDGRALRRLAEFRAATGLDAVALTYETEQANAGEASRAARLLNERWGTDLVLVAVARPGHFEAASDPTVDEPARFFGVEPADRFTVPGGLRERVVERVVPPVAGQDRWSQAFIAALDALEQDLAGAAGGGEAGEGGP